MPTPLLGGDGDRDRLGRERLEHEPEPLEELAVEQAPRGVELLVGAGDGQLVADDAGAGGAEDPAAGRPAPTSRRTGRGSRRRRNGLVRSAASSRGRDAQSIAFFSPPGTEPLYSGVAKRIASAAPHASRRRATGSGALTRVEVLVVQRQLARSRPDRRARPRRPPARPRRPPRGGACCTSRPARLPETARILHD